MAAFYVNFNEDDEVDDEADIDDDAEKKFRIFCTTKKLLKIALKSSKIHADATYKLIWEGVPVLINGTTDMDRHFHPYGINVCSNEKTADFEFIFTSLLESL